MSEADDIEAMARAIVRARGGDPDECVHGFSWAAGEMGKAEGGSVCHRRSWELRREDAQAAYSIVRERMREMEDALANACDAIRHSRHCASHLEGDFPCDCGSDRIRTEARAALTRRISDDTTK